MLYVTPGCLVTVDPRIACVGRETYTAKVVQVRDRHEHYNNGEVKARPLVTVVRDDNGEEQNLDALLVIEILSRPHLLAGPPLNIYAEDKRERSYDYMLACGRCGEWVGTLWLIAEHCLSQLHRYLPTPVDRVKLKALFMKQRPGLIESMGHGFLRVRRKPFEAWIRRNATRICKTIEQTDAERTALNTEWERDMEADMMADMEDWLDREEQLSGYEPPMGYDDGVCGF